MNQPALQELQTNIVDLGVRAYERHLDCSHLTLEEAERLGELLSTLAKGIGFWLGDLARYSEAKWPDTFHQVWPISQSPGQLSRNAAVCRAYPEPHDRRHDLSFSQYMQVSGKPDRQVRLLEMAEKGQTTDESRKTHKQTPISRTVSGATESPGWLLAVDCNLYLHKFYHSGAGVEAASAVASWIDRIAKKLIEDHGFTDLVCCFDSQRNFRKDLTKDSEHKYKDRGAKDPELVKQLNFLHDRLGKLGFCCVSAEGFEADDLLASYAHQYKCRVSLLTHDKDANQCLSKTTNLLHDVEWVQDDITAEYLPVYGWFSAGDLWIATGGEYGDDGERVPGTGIRADQWIDFQTIRGDNCDGIKGAIGIGEKGAADMIKMFGDADTAIAAAKDGDERIKPKQRDALLGLEPRLEITRQLVTLRNDLPIPFATRLT